MMEKRGNFKTGFFLDWTESVLALGDAIRFDVSADLKITLAIAPWFHLEIGHQNFFRRNFQLLKSTLKW